MHDLSGKVAFVTGGATGMGLGIARAAASAGMRVVVTDIRVDALTAAITALRDEGHDCLGLPLDVTDRDAWVRVVSEAERRYKRIHLLCHNVGGGGFGHLIDSSYDDWDWFIRLNLGGPINAIHTVLPRIKAHGEGGHIVVTASMAGIVPVGLGGVYSTAKAAVVGLMESLRGELLHSNIGVSVLCPGLTRTSGATTQLRPAQYADTGYRYAPPAGFSKGGGDLMREAMDPDEVGRKVLAGVQRNQLYILTHSEFGDMIRSQFDELFAAMPPPRPAVPRPASMSEGGTSFGEMYRSEHVDP